MKNWFTPPLLFAIISTSLLGQNTFGPSDLLNAFAPPKAENLKVSLVSEEKAIVPGSTSWVAAKFEIADEWHIYWKNPGSVGGPVTLDWDLPEGFTAGEVHYPTPKDYFEDGAMSHTYEGTVYLMVPITAPAEIKTEEIQLKAEGVWFVCKKGECQRKKGTLGLTLPVSNESDKNEEVATAFAKTRELWPEDGKKLNAKASYDQGSLLLEFTDKEKAILSTPPKKQKDNPKLELNILILAFFGGAMLNLMPCVFPVIGLKIMGFVNQAGENKKSILQHGIIYTLGVLVSFWILTSVLQILRQGGAELGWGFQLQDARFNIGLAILLLVFSLNLSGLFEFGTSLMGAGSNLSNKGGMKGTFFSGMLATAVSTPCAGPLIGPALGVALSLSTVDSFILFTVMALGLSFPYLLLSAFPVWVKKLPKPGPWMETFKQLMAFPLYGTVMALLWVLRNQLDDIPYLVVLLVMIVIALAGWIYGRWFGKSWSKLTAGLLFIISAGVAFSMVPEKRVSPPVSYDHLYFFPEPALADKSHEQELPETQEFETLQGNKTYVKLQLVKGAENHLSVTDGRLKGILVLEEGKVKRSYHIDAPLKKVKSTGASLAKAKGKHSGSKLDWQTWSPEIQEQLLAEDKILFIDFTASWCATCIWNKSVALSSKEIAQKFKDAGIITLKADWTNDDPAITRELAKYNRGAVPFNVFVLPNDKGPIELPELLTEGIVANAIDEVVEKMKPAPASVSNPE